MMAAATILNFEKLLAIHYDLANHHQIKWECSKSDVKHICCVEKNGTINRFQDGGCRHLEFRKTAANSLFFTSAHQIWWECCDLDVERTCQVEK